MSTNQTKPVELDKIYQWINELCMPATRENALIELSRQREAVQDLAPYLWHSFGSIAALLQEVISVYPAINPPTLTVILNILIENKIKKNVLTSFIFNIKGSPI
jgi:CCR4-NOT transcription complex subunit 9